MVVRIWPASRLYRMHTLMMVWLSRRGHGRTAWHGIEGALALTRDPREWMELAWGGQVKVVWAPIAKHWLKRLNISDCENNCGTPAKHRSIGSIENILISTIKMCCPNAEFNLRRWADCFRGEFHELFGWWTLIVFCTEIPMFRGNFFFWPFIGF